MQPRRRKYRTYPWDRVLTQKQCEVLSAAKRALTFIGTPFVTAQHVAAELGQPATSTPLARVLDSLVYRRWLEKVSIERLPPTYATFMNAHTRYLYGLADRSHLHELSTSLHRTSWYNDPMTDSIMLARHEQAQRDEWTRPFTKPKPTT